MAKRSDGMSSLEAEWLTYWQQLAPNAPEPVREFRFCERRFRFDFAWVESRVAVELEGSAYTQGRHTRGVGYESDCTKYNLAVALGWRVFRFTRGLLRRDPIACVDLVRNAIEPLVVAEVYRQAREPRVIAEAA